METSRQILTIYHAYRLTIGLALLVLSYNGLLSAGQTPPELFRQAIWSYLILNLFFALAVRHSTHHLRLTLLALVDLGLLLFLFHTAGGTLSGIGNLIVMAVAIASILLERRMALLLAALASLGMILITVYQEIAWPNQDSSLVRSGTLGALCFASALLVQTLTCRLQRSEALARQRGQAVASLEALNAMILQRIRTGIIVIDSSLQIRQANQSACQLLGHGVEPGQQLATAAPELQQRLQIWQQNPRRRPPPLHADSQHPGVQVAFSALQDEPERHLLIFLDDLTRLSQQAQQLKLASLGRLTASIAHEIRNPLGAISHAVQLLQENEPADPGDQRLIGIIRAQSQRMNAVIENVLDLSRQRRAEASRLDLNAWLRQFIRDCELRPRPQLILDAPEMPVESAFDSGQLQQIISNLIQNGQRYSPSNTLWLKLQIIDELPVLEIIDDGPGIAPEQQQHIFEPFYTTEKQGTGLGLYICRELCESNQARLDYLPAPLGGGCFRIIFAHPNREWMETSPPEVNPSVP